ncbi:hypothetical protein [Streptomyces californicus]|uniref:hypothetical protein n=1 Tax=Streptomyces californicus TaxID=67351 RepID=UPI00379BEE3D
MFTARLRPTAPMVLASLALSLPALSGCSSSWFCHDTTAERGEAGRKVQVVDTGGQPLGVTVEAVGWRLKPHPQVPAEGDKVHFDYRFDGADESRGPTVDACAVDKDRVALRCTTVGAAGAWPEPDGTRTGDDWLDVDHPGQVAAVLFLPNDQSHDRPPCAADPKDGGGTHPPESASTGDRL